MCQSDTPGLAVCIGLYLPAFIGLGENVAGNNSNCSSSNYVMRMMRPTRYPAVSDKRRHSVGRHAILPAVMFAQELGLRKGKRRMSRRKRVGATNGSLLFDAVFEGVGDTKRQRS